MKIVRSFIKKRSVLIFFCLMFIGVLVVARIVQERWAIYPYSVKQDYHYNFDEAQANEVAMENGVFLIPKEVQSSDAVFLKVKTKASFMGKFFQPSLELSSDDRVYKQYFEHGAKGVRYLNLSSLVQAGKRKIRIKEDRISFDPNGATLFYFNQTDLSDSNILIVSPHPDDAEIAAFGLYSKYPNNSFVLTVSAGEGGEFNYDELYSDSKAHFFKKGEIRTWNSVTVPLIGGVKPENVLNLGFFDGTLQEMYEDKAKNVSSDILETQDISTFRKYNLSPLKDSLTGQSNWHSLVANFRMIVRNFRPDVIVTPHPVLDSHPDHQLSTVAVLQALKDLEIKEGKLFFYSNHYFLNEYVPYGRTGGVVSLPPLFEEEIQLDEVYSYEMDQNQQAEKTLALDAMNDLRPDTEWRFWKASFDHLVERTKVALVGHDNSYYKRAVRSNELFWVVPVKKIYDESLQKAILGNYRLN